MPAPANTAHAFGLAGRTVAVTGATGGLGRGVVRTLAAHGARVVGVDARPITPEIRETLETLDTSSGVTLIGDVDLTDEAQVQALYGRIAAESPGGLWASVHLVGGFSMAPVAETTGDELLRMFRLNALTAFLCSREAIRAMRSAGGGRIVNVAARPALSPVGGMVAYSASKAAVVSLTTSLAEEVKKDRIWVNAIAPSIMDTPDNRAAMPKADHERWPSVDDVASAIAYLASPTNALTTGLVMPVYGLA